MAGITLAEIAAKLGAELRGDGTVVIESIAGMEQAGQGQITFFCLAANTASTLLCARHLP